MITTPNTLEVKILRLQIEKKKWQTDSLDFLNYNKAGYTARQSWTVGQGP